jgi:spore coat polysaccharide biosynthesis protein SpsF (cytidylyltransferase family)
MKVVAILQQRLGSKRLPCKALLNLAGKNMTQNIIERVQRAKKLDLIALTYPAKDDELREVLWRNNIYLSPWEGDENDLVGRYLHTATITKADIIVRVPCDNPCIEPEYIDKAVEYYLDQPCVFYTNADAVWIDAMCIDGLGCEVFSMSRLKWLDRRTNGNKEQREHPHKFFNDEDACHGNWRSQDALRLDVNTPADYDFIKRIYDHFGHNKFHVSEVLSYLESVRAV